MENNRLRRILFITCVESSAGVKNARIMVNSFRRFAADMREAEFWIFEQSAVRGMCGGVESLGIKRFPLDVPNAYRGHLFSEVVETCAQTEAMAAQNYESMVWVDSGCLFFQAPRMLNLEQNFDAAVRPVHLRNIGVKAVDDVDIFWHRVSRVTRGRESGRVVRSFVEDEPIKPYFNSHCFAINPRLGLMRLWREAFLNLVNDVSFQAGCCADRLHQTFLFQAVLSKLLEMHIPWERIRLLPVSYNYPLHLHDQIPPERKVNVMDDLVVVTNEGEPIQPETFPDIQVSDGVAQWLATAYK